MKSIISWSGGKDSCLALLKARGSGYRIKALITAMNDSGTFSKSNGVPVEIIKEAIRSSEFAGYYFLYFMGEL